MMRVFVYEHVSAGALADGAADDLLAAGRAMRDAVAHDLLASGEATVTVAAGPRAAAVPSGARALAPPADVAAVDFVAQQARLHDRVWVIAPECGGVLAQLQRAVDVRRDGALRARRWIGCDAGAIALTSSKHATLTLAAAHGIATPLAYAASPTTRRWVVKPDDGAGAIATRLHNTHAAARDDVQARRQHGESAVLEAWVAGEPLSLSLLCAGGRVELLGVNRQSIAIDAVGIVSFEGVQIDVLAHDDARFATLRGWARTLVRAMPGLEGYVGIDLVWHPQRGPVLIEVNPRVTMAYVGLSARLGRNLAAEVLAATCTEPAHGDA